MLLIALGLFVVAAVVVARSIVIVPRDVCFVVERLGRFDRVLTAGLHVVPPFVSRITARLPTGDQRVDVAPRRHATRDGDEVTGGVTILFRVVEPRVAAAAAVDYRQALIATADRWLARAIGRAEAVSAPSAPGEALADLEAAAATLGVAIVSIQPQVELSDRAMAALARQATAARDERIADWVAARGERPGADGRPTDAQRSAYDAWLALEVRAHAREIAAAKTQAEPGSAAAPPAAVPVATAGPVTAATSRSTMAPGEGGTVDADGRRWPARNVSSSTIGRGFPCAVVGREGDTLLVRAL